MYIKRAILKYGKENFNVETIEDCDASMLDERERYYIKLYNSFEDGYNGTIGGQDGRKPLQTPKGDQEKVVELYEYGFSLRAIGKEFHIDHATVKGILVHNGIAIRKTRSYKLSTKDRENIIFSIAAGDERSEIL